MTQDKEATMPMFVMLALLLIGPPTHLTVTLRAASYDRFRVTFAWQPPDTGSGYRYVWKAIQGSAVQRMTTTAKSATVRLTRTHTPSSYTLCVATLTATGYQSADACRTLAVPQVDSPQIVLRRDTSVHPVDYRPSAERACLYVWIHGKVIRDPPAVLVGQGVDVWRGTSWSQCPAYLPASLVWPAP